MRRRRNKKNGRRNNNYILTVLLVLLVITIVTGVSAWVWSRYAARQDKPVTDLSEVSSRPEEESPETQSPETEEPQTQSSETESTEEESTQEQPVYPEPEYNFRTEEIVVEVPGISEEYTVAWVSDLHMVTDHGTAPDVLDTDIDAVKARYDFFVTADGVHGEDLLPGIIDFLNYGMYDGIIFGGDMLDYCSVSNMNLLKSEFKRLDKKVPVLYIRADHDYGFWYGGDAFTETDAENMHKEMDDGDDLNEKYLDFGEFVIIGVNRSTKDMMPEQYDILEEMFARAGDKPVIVATHVPYASQVDDTNDVSLYDRSMEIRNKIYYWGGGDYVANDVTGAFLDKVYRTDTQVNTVLAGHLHAGWDGMITQQVRQHIFEPAYLGSIGIIKIIPKKE